MTIQKSFPRQVVVSFCGRLAGNQGYVCFVIKPIPWGRRDGLIPFPIFAQVNVTKQGEFVLDSPISHCELTSITPPRKYRLAITYPKLLKQKTFENRNFHSIIGFSIIYLKTFETRTIYLKLLLFLSSYSLATFYLKC